MEEIDILKFLKEQLDYCEAEQRWLLRKIKAEAIGKLDKWKVQKIVDQSIKLAAAQRSAETLEKSINILEEGSKKNDNN